MTRIATIILLTMLQLSTAAAEDIRIGYVDMKRLLDNAPQLQQSKEKLDREFNERYQGLMAQEENLNGMVTRMETDGPFMTENERARLELDINIKRRQLIRDKEDYLDELTYRRGQETQKVEQFLEETTKNLAVELGLDLLLTSPTVIYSSERVDLTDTVLKRLGADTAKEENPSRTVGQ